MAFGFCDSMTARPYEQHPLSWLQAPVIALSQFPGTQAWKATVSTTPPRRWKPLCATIGLRSFLAAETPLVKQLYTCQLLPLMCTWSLAASTWEAVCLIISSRESLVPLKFRSIFVRNSSAFLAMARSKRFNFEEYKRMKSSNSTLATFLS